MTVADLPGAPTNVAATAGDGYVRISWNSPTTNGGSSYTPYAVVRYLADGTADTVAAGLPRSPRSYDYASPNGVAYKYSVHSYNSSSEKCGDYGVGFSCPAFNPLITARGVPDAPTNVSATGGGQVLACQRCRDETERVQ